MKSKLNRRNFLKYSGLTLACGLVGCSESEKANSVSGLESGKKPNFVVFMADDIGACELSCYGNKEYNTPVLDELARTGVQYRTCYASPVCHPTRFMIMTGQYGCHNGVYNFSGKRGGPDRNSPVEDIGKNHITFAEILKPEGYATGLAGKWQLSGEYPTAVHDAGFDEYCIWAYRRYLSPEDQKKYKSRRRYWDPSVMKNGKLLDTKTDDYGPDIFMDFAVDFIEKNRSRPFFLYYPMCLTHGPWYKTPDTTKTLADRRKKDKANFKDNVEYMDKLIGRLVEALDRAGVRDNTIIFFTGDNGTGGGGGKSTATELGARVPMIVNCPGVVKKQGEVDDLTDLSDVFVTLADYAGAKVPCDRPIDGVSMRPTLSGADGPRRDWIFSFIADRRILRDRRWLLEDNSPLHYGRLYDCGSSRDGKDYKEVTDSKDPEVLAARAKFDRLIAKLPAPHIPYEGPPNAPKPGMEKNNNEDED